MHIYFKNINEKNSKELTDPSFVLTVKDEDAEIWISANIVQNKIIIKTPKDKRGNGYPDIFDFTVKQLLNVIKKSKKVKNDE